MTSRFRDNAETVYDFIFKSDDVLVECPFCKRCARGVKIPHENYAFNLICGYCGILPKPSFGSWGNGTFMGLNLWLKTNCCGDLLWAYNKVHLEFLDNYINASLRERIPNKNQSLASRLPDWIKSSKNRQELIKGVGKLNDRLEHNVIR